MCDKMCTLVTPKDGDIFINQNGTVVMNIHTLIGIVEGNVEISSGYVKVRRENEG